MAYRQDHIDANVLRARTVFKLGLGNGETLAGARTVVDGEGPILAFDAGGSSRNVTLPARADVNDGVLLLINNESTAGENLVIKNSAATTLLTLPSSGVALIIATGTDEAPGTRNWKAVPIGGEDLALADSAVITGNLSVAGNFTMGNSVVDVGSFFGATGSSQPAGASQAAVTNSAAVSISATQWAFTTSTQCNQIVSLVNQMRADLVTLGLLKGSA